MADRTIVPRTIYGFGQYIVRTDDRLLAINPASTNPWWTDYALTLAVQKEWHDRRIGLLTNLLPANVNPLTRNDLTRAALHTAISQFATFAENPLKVIAGSPVSTHVEEVIFNFKIGHADPVQNHTPITHQCIARITAEGGGLYDIMCRVAEDATRSSKDPFADVLQYAYFIGAADAVTNPDDARLTIEQSTHAHFHHDFGGANQTQWLTLFFRWFNTKHPELKGPWSPVQKLVIS
jgi:hypothetical protein